jgi:transposase
MPKKKYLVALRNEQRVELEELTKKGTICASKMNHVRILLLADINNQKGGWTDANISEALNISVATIERVRQRFVESGMQSALQRREPKNRRHKIIDGEKEAHLIALACSETPMGKAKWTLQMLAEQMVELKYVEQVSKETIRQTLKKTN